MLPLFYRLRSALAGVASIFERVASLWRVSLSRALVAVASLRSASLLAFVRFRVQHLALACVAFVRFRSRQLTPARLAPRSSLPHAFAHVASLGCMSLSFVLSHALPPASPRSSAPLPSLSRALTHVASLGGVSLSRAFVRDASLRRASLLAFAPFSVRHFTRASVVFARFCPCRIVSHRVPLASVAITCASSLSQHRYQYRMPPSGRSVHRCRCCRAA